MRTIKEILECTDWGELDHDEVCALVDYKCEHAAKRATAEALEGERCAAIRANTERAEADSQALRELAAAYEPPRLEVLNFG